jgi:hypothetical protein
VNSKLVEIPENAFGKLNFEIIQIGEKCSSLERIHPNAFSHQSKTTIDLWIQARNVIPNKSLPNSFYDLVNSFENLRALEYHSKIGTLEEKFGKNLNNLISLRLRVDAIQGTPFSNMSKLVFLGLIEGGLNSVSKNILKTAHSFGISSLDLSNNKLNSSSFENGIFTSNSQNKVPDSVSLKGNQITFLDEAIFKPYLIKGKVNYLKLGKNPLDCDDCRSAWICKSEDSEKIGRGFAGDVLCVDKRDFTDCSNNFLKCK